jgi:3-oxoacyl-[acyl-carrier protein] reductase
VDLQLEGKVALITGASKGIGRATALAFAEEGCHVAICARDTGGLAAARDKIAARGVRVATATADVCDSNDAERLINTCVGELGGLDILVNNVGGAIGASRLLETTDDDWRQTYEVNLVQSARMMRLAAPQIQTRGGGAIINIASISGWSPQLVGRGQYGAAKAALIFDAERWALEFVPHRIRVNTVSPGSILCPGNGWDLFRQREPDIFAEYEREGFPMGRLGQPHEVADVIVFLASPRANWINGRNIPVDGLEQPVPRRDQRLY